MKTKVLTGWQAVAHCPDLWRQCAEGYPVQCTIYTDTDDDKDENREDKDKSKEKIISCVLPATVEKTEAGIRNFFTGLARQLDSDRKAGRLTSAEYSKALRAIRTREGATLKALTDGRLTLVEGSAKTTTDPALLAEYAYLAGKAKKEVERLTGIFSYRSKIPDDIRKLQNNLDRYTSLRACIVKKYGRDNATARRITLRAEAIRTELQTRKAEAIRGNLYAVWQYPEAMPYSVQLVAKDIPNFTDAVLTVKKAIKNQFKALLTLAGSPDKVAETCNRRYSTGHYRCNIELPMLPYSAPRVMPGYSTDFERACRLAGDDHKPFTP